MSYLRLVQTRVAQWSKHALRITVLLGASALNPSHAAPSSDCIQPNANAADTGTFNWNSLPSLPAAPVQGAYKIAVWGDSLTSARIFMDAALQTAGVEKSAVLPSFIQAGMKVPNLSLPLKFSCASSGWKTAYAYREKGSTPGFSQGMLSMESSSPGDLIVMDFRAPLPTTRVRQLDILYEKASPESSLLLGVSIDGQAEKLVPLSRSAASVLRIAPQTPMATVRIRLVSGQIKIHGFQPQYQAAPAVVLDSMSVPGAVARGWNYVDERLLPGGSAAAAPDYDLILVQYGTNEGANPAYDIASYAQSLRASLSRLRKLHADARCILIGPPDRGVANGQAGNPLKYSTIHRQIATAQRKVSAEYGCGFWDWQGETGGAGTALRWLHSQPQLMQPDLTHMTAKGYDASGRAFARFFPLPIPKHPLQQ